MSFNFEIKKLKINMSFIKNHESSRTLLEGTSNACKVIHCESMGPKRLLKESLVGISSSDTIGDIINLMIKTFNLKDCMGESYSNRRHLTLLIQISDKFKVLLMRKSYISTHIKTDMGSYGESICLSFTQNEKFGELFYENINMFDSISEDSYLKIFTYALF
jgi:hypothetical protein